jgi:hypothetical protein
MSDAVLAGIARDLAKALNKYARERTSPEGQQALKAITLLHTALCAAYRDDLAELQPPAEPSPEETR